jgi:hypothetical protein
MSYPEYLLCTLFSTTAVAIALVWGWATWRIRHEQQQQLRRHLMPSYHIVYHLVVKNEAGELTSGFGSTTYCGPLTTKDTVNTIADMVREHLKAEQVVITNWIELPEEPEIGQDTIGEGCDTSAETTS